MIVSLLLSDFYILLVGIHFAQAERSEHIIHWRALARKRTIHVGSIHASLPCPYRLTTGSLDFRPKPTDDLFELQEPAISTGNALIRKGLFEPERP